MLAEAELPADLVVLSARFVSLREAVRSCLPGVSYSVVGDAKEPRSVMDAIAEAREEIDQLHSRAATGMSDRLDGLAVLVTGAASGIGRVGRAAPRLGRARSVACLDRDASGPRRDGLGPRGAAALVADVTDARRDGGRGRRDARGVRAHRRARLASPASRARAARTSSRPPTGSASSRVNLTGTFHAVRAVLPPMLEQGAGSIVLVSSVAGTTGIPGLAAYSAAKAGVIGLGRQLAVDYGPEGIRANVLCPGTIRTPMMERLYASGAGMASSGGAPLAGDEIVAAAARRIPLRRIGEPRGRRRLGALPRLARERLDDRRRVRRRRRGHRRLSLPRCRFPF